MISYFDALLRYFEFSGRSTRSQYWLFQLFVVLLTCAALFIDVRLLGYALDGESFGITTAFVVFFHLVPSVTVTARRLHDIGKSGWWYLLNLVPLGGLVLLFWMCRGSVEGGEDHVEPAPYRPSTRPSPLFNRAQQTLAQIDARRATTRLAP